MYKSHEYFINFVKNKNKNSFCQSPLNYLQKNNLINYSFLIGNTSKETFSNMNEFVYGIPICKFCKKEHHRHLSWNKWSITCSNDCTFALSSERQQGANNTCYKMTKETKIRTSLNQSILMKEKIKNKEFTPKTENYKTFGMINFMLNGKERQVRSLWELIYWLKNPNLEYEKIRVEYYDSILEKNRIYITDFYDKDTNTVIEIKPKKYFYTLKDKLQSEELKKYNFLWINDDYYKNIKTKELIEEIKNVVTNYEKIKQRLTWISKELKK